jgi:VWFA-related protein
MAASSKSYQRKLWSGHCHRPVPVIPLGFVLNLLPMRNFTLPILLSTFLLHCPAITKAQQQTPATDATPAQEKPVLRSFTRLVQVNVIVHNKKGEPVPDLKKEDFTLLDENHPQEIAVFSAESSAKLSALPKPLPPNVFTNVPEAIGQVPGSVTVVLFDALNTSFEDQAHARAQIVKFLKQLKPQDHVAIYLLTSGGQLSVIQDFTFDTSVLLDALNQFASFSPTQLEAANPKPIQLPTATTNPRMKVLQDFLNTGMGQISDTAEEARARKTSYAIEAIANHLARIPGRKNIVWVSGSFPLAIGYSGYQLPPLDRAQADFSEFVLRAARAANQADVAIYPVDARGLMTTGDISASPQTAFDREHLPGLDLPDEINFDSMTLLADRTGGKAFHNTNDIQGAIRDALSDGEYTYTLGFYPNHGKWNGNFHELKIRANAPGATVRYRKGYFATPANHSNSEAATKEAMDMAMFSPVEAVALDVAIEVKHPKALPAQTLRFVVGLDARQILMAEQDGHHKGALTFLFAQMGPGGKALSRESLHVPLDCDTQSYAATLQKGITLTRNLPIVPNVSFVRVVVQDSISGAMGTVTIPLQAFLPLEAGQTAIKSSIPKN